VYFKEYHVERSVEFWDNFMKGKAEDFILLIENVLEDEPRMLREMMEKLEAKGHNLGVCLDIGHALCISDVDIIEWIRTIGKYIRHVHLHNNDGSGDRHDIFDCENCKADMQEVLDALKEYGAEDMTYTIESLNPKEAMRWLVEKGYVEE